MLKRIITYQYLGGFCQYNSADQGLDTLTLQIAALPGRVTLTLEQGTNSYGCF